jgi:hypothetical protein
MRIIVRRTHCLLFLSLLIGSAASSKDLTGRIGLGYNTQFGSSSSLDGVPAVSFKYGLARYMQFQMIAGLNTKTPSEGVAAAKILTTLISENYVNPYLALGLGYVSKNSNSGIQMLGGIGAEFFIPGVDNVGISFEAGLTLENATQSSFILRTYGASFLEAGIHYYF